MYKSPKEVDKYTKAYIKELKKSTGSIHTSKVIILIKIFIDR